MVKYLSLITQQDTQRFIHEHEHDDERQLVLRHKEINGVPSSLIAAQLSGRRKAKTKLPTWYNTDGIFFPPTVNIEQCSSEATAIYKATIIKESTSSNNLAADLTGGFGVDSYFLSKAFNAIHYVEPNVELMEMAQHNHHQLGATNITHHCITAEHFIDHTNLKFDLIFIDPSRRDEQSRRVYKLTDCTPDITQLQSALFAISNFILLKASPLLDIQQVLLEIKYVKKVIVVSIGNECKELLFLAEKDYDQEPMIDAVTLFENGSIRSSVSFTFVNERMANVSLGEPGLYLYEPNASVLKAGAFKWIGEKFGLTKLDANTHLYTSTKALPDFPGKVFFIECLNPDAKQLKEFLPMGLVNVVSRNYPLTTDGIKKKYRLRDGGSLYLIGFTSAKKKYLALCSKVTYT